MKPIHAFSMTLVAFAFVLISQFVPVHGDNDKLDFTLVNKTGYGIKAVYVAPSSQTDWGDSIISAPLENGDSLAISFPPKEKAEKWDIRIEWVDEGAAVYWKGYKLSEINKITLHYDRATDTTSAETE